MFVMDIPYVPVQEPTIVLAQTPTPPAVIVSPQKPQNWTGGDERILRNFQQYMDVHSPDGIKALGLYEYRAEGPRGMPALTVNSETEYTLSYTDAGSSYVMPQLLQLAGMACLWLDIEAGEPGAWGPECKIAKFIKLPEGKLEKWNDPRARPGDYMYTPPRIGTDTLRFIVENGAGRQVDVTVNLKASSYQGGALDIEKPMLAEAGRGDGLAAAFEMMLAQAPTLPVQVAPPQKPQNWIGGDKSIIKNIKRWLTDDSPEGLKMRGIYRYSPESTNGMPVLVLNIPIDYYISSYEPIKVSSQSIGLAQNACIFLDIEAKQAGAWGPECKIAKFITLPEGKLEKWNDPRALPGDYMYTPPRIGTDTLRFIIDNGAGRQVDVTINLNASSYQDGALDVEKRMFAELGKGDGFAAALGPKPLSTWLSAAGSSLTFDSLANEALGQTTGHTITPDDSANGYNWYIDLTPDQNEEFLPTTNPYVWVAKPGSEAEGKMDMLTVLLHEAAEISRHNRR